MKQTLIILLIFYALEVFSQTGPAGVGNSTNNEIWLQVEGNCYSDLGTTLGGDGASIQQWNDLSGNGNHAIQSTNSFRPMLSTNSLNGFSTLSFDGNNDRILSSGVNTSHQLTLFVVFSYASGSTNNHEGVIQASPLNLAFSGTSNNKVLGMFMSSTTKKTWGRGVQSNNSIRSLPEGLVELSSGSFYLITQDYNGSTIDQYINGAEDGGTISYNGTLKDWREFGIGRQGSETLKGSIAEIIVYTESVNAAQRLIIHNYLAAKYGLSLDYLDLYDGDNMDNGNYDYEVAGIGQINSEIHNESQGTGILRILNPSNLNENEFLIWGHDNGEALAIEASDIPMDMDARMERVWRVSEVNSSSDTVNVGAVDLRFDLSGLGSVSASELRLLVDTDNDGFFVDETSISGAIDLTGNIFQFSGVTQLEDSLRFTIGISNSALPVDVINFDVYKDNNDNIVVNWQTVAQTNNLYFTIERSQNGYQWEALNQIPGAGNSNDLLMYSAVDRSPFKGNSYYRLKQTDINGTSTYSSMKSVFIDFEGREDIVFPNPSPGEFFLLTKEIEEDQVQILNSIGQDVTDLAFIRPIDKEKLQIDMTYLDSGIYYIKHKFTAIKVYKK